MPLKMLRQLTLIPLIPALQLVPRRLAALRRVRGALVRLRFFVRHSALYLDTIGLSTTAIGWIFTAALAGGAVMTVIITSIADRVGRKNLLILGAILMARICGLQQSDLADPRRDL